MPKEIERKFLVRKDLWYAIRKPKGQSIRQGYLVTDPAKTVRVRLAGKKAFLAVKGPVTKFTRNEYEYSIPWEQGQEILEKFTSVRVEKVRYTVPFEGKSWEVDEFFGENEGLIVAELELSSENETFTHPQWLGEEVTGDARYYNSNLALYPFKGW